MTGSTASPTIPAGEAERPMLLFRVGSELFAFDLAVSEEAMEWPALERMPEMPAGLLGVFALRGQLVPVYTPERALSVTRTGTPGVVVVARARGRRVALAVDDVEDVIMVDPMKMLQPPVPDAANGTLLGVVRRGEELVSIVDAAALLRACAGTGAAAEEDA